MHWGHANVLTAPVTKVRHSDIHLYAHVCVHVGVCLSVHVCVHVCVCMCVRACVNVVAWCVRES